MLDVWTPQHSFLRCSVYNNRSTMLGRSGGKQLLGSEVVPLRALRCGYRSLQLRSPNGCTIEGCKLLLHVTMTSFTGGPRKPRTNDKDLAPLGGWSRLRGRSSLNNVKAPAAAPAAAAP